VFLLLVDGHEAWIPVENFLPFLFAFISEVRVFSVSLWSLNLLTKYRGFHPTSSVTFKVCKSMHHHTIPIKQLTRCKHFSSLLLDVYVRLSMFRAFSRPSSGAQQLQLSSWWWAWERPKHVEPYINVKKWTWEIIASSWLIYWESSVTFCFCIFQCISVRWENKNIDRWDVACPLL
jgi:hypothetical protein